MIDAEENGFLITYDGDVHGDALIEANKQLIEHPNFKTAKYQIWDFRKGQSINLSTQQLRYLAHMDFHASKHNPEMIIAFVASDHFLMSWARLYHIYSQVWEGFENKTFNEMEDARAWIEQEFGS